MIFSTTLKSVLLIFTLFSNFVFADYFVIAFDIEASGSNLVRHGIVSIGASIQDQDSNEIESFQVNLKLPANRIYEPRCIEQFWSKNPVIQDFVELDAKDPDVATQEFRAFVDSAESKFKDLRIVSDNPSFDIQWLNYYLSVYTDRLPLNFDIRGEYTNIWDTHAIQKTLLATEYGDVDSEWGLPALLHLTSKWSHDHNPLNDARTIADYYNQTVKMMNIIASRVKGK